MGRPTRVTIIRRLAGIVTTVALAASLLSACAGPGTGGTVTEPGSSGDPSSLSSGGPGSPPLSSLQPPTLRQGEPPKSPTDQQGQWIAGRVTRGGSGPCYGLETDDGTGYAMYSDLGVTLETGAIVRVRVEPARGGVDCGPGTPVRIVEIEPVS